MVSSDRSVSYPPPESQGGWPRLRDPEDIRERAGLDSRKLDRAAQRQREASCAGDSWSIVIVRHGLVVREYHSFCVLAPTRFDIWSCTKSFTSTAWGLLLEGRPEDALIVDQSLELDTPAYSLIPEGRPLSDPRKDDITVGHLLSMTSGIAGQKGGIRGMATEPWHGPFEHALGRSPNWSGIAVGDLAADPGSDWDYSDPGWAHLSLMFWNVTGKEMAEFLQERIFDPIGIENLSWDVQGGSGFIGPHTNAHTGIHVSARELARFGYLFLRGGSWNGKDLIPPTWIELATKTSQEHNPNYGYGWWVNSAGTHWPYLPRDAYAAYGYRSNYCYVIPSLDLVVVRIGSGPTTWDERELIGAIVDAVD